MHFQQLAEVFPVMLDIGHSMELISKPGRGKSTFVHDQVSINALRTGCEWGLAEMNLGVLTPQDIVGFMVPGYDEKKRRISEFTLPPWMRTVNGGNVEDYQRGILFLDEFGQAEGELKKVSAELLLNRRVGPWYLPKGWSVVAASNRFNDRSGVTRNFDFVINRRSEIHISDHFESFKVWAIANGVDYMLISFAESNISIVFSEEGPKVQGPWCTPRSLVKAGEIVNALRTINEDGTPGPIPTNEVVQELIASWIGEGAMLQLMATVKLDNAMPKMADILNNPGSAAVPDEPDSMMLVTYKLAAAVNQKNIQPIAAYINRFPKEFRAVWMKTATKYNSLITTAKPFQDMYMQNTSLFTAIVASGA